MPSAYIQLCTEVGAELNCRARADSTYSFSFCAAYVCASIEHTRSSAKYRCKSMGIVGLLILVSAPTDMIQHHQNAICQHTDVGYSCVLSSASQICFVHDKVWYAYPRAPSSWGDISSDFDSSSDES